MIKTRRMIHRFITTFSLCALLMGAAFTGWYVQPFIQGEQTYDELRETCTSPGAEAHERTEEAGVSTAGENGGKDTSPFMEANRREFDWEHLASINPDVIGWIYVPNTPIDYPVVQAPQTDPDKYLRTTFEGEVSYPNNQGTIFLDADNAEDGFDAMSPVLYGHYQLNQSMFSAFSGNGDIDSLSKHAQVLIYTPTKMFHVELFAGNYVNAEQERIRTSFESKDELDLWLQSKLDESEAVLYEPGDIDQLFTFVTCSYSIWQDQRTLTYGRVIESISL